MLWKNWLVTKTVAGMLGKNRIWQTTPCLSKCNLSNPRKTKSTATVNLTNVFHCQSESTLLMNQMKEVIPTMEDVAVVVLQVKNSWTKEPAFQEGKRLQD